MTSSVQRRLLLVVLAASLAGCDGSRATAPAAPTTPTVPAAVFPTRILTGVSLSGVVYELTPTGRKPISRALVYCELCGKETHTFATADDNGFYQFSGDLATGGGVWLAPGVPTPINVGYYNPDFEDPPGLLRPRQGPGWREVQIDGDTRFDIELVRRAAATP